MTHIFIMYIIYYYNYYHVAVSDTFYVKRMRMCEVLYIYSRERDRCVYQYNVMKYNGTRNVYILVDLPQTDDSNKSYDHYSKCKRKKFSKLYDTPLK